MVPVSFGPPQGAIFGAYHPPRLAHEHARTVGIVLCNPIGWEAIAAQRAYRVLAERLARAGYPVLRFDYLGTGDSSGDETGSECVSSWFDSIDLAIDELKTLAGVERVAAFGTHLGATLAAATASRRHDVASLVLWAPFLTGRTYLRQIRAYRMLNGSPSVGAHAETKGEEAAGFLLPPPTVSAVSKLDLLGEHLPQCPAVLVVARDEQSPEHKLVRALDKGGGQVEHARIDGYLKMMQEPRKSVIPERVFAAVEAWLEQTHPRSGPAVGGGGAQRTAVLAAGGNLTERARFFGPSARLFGLVTEPSGPTDPRRPTLVWLNTASDHRIGPNRLYVTLARRLAHLGFRSLRFDPRGVGDCNSDTLPQVAHAYSSERLQDARDAIDWLASEYGATRFALIGLCSAAYVAFHTALADPRVVSEILINPQTFVWHDGDSLELSVRQSYGGNRYYQRRFRDVDTWRRMLNGEINVSGVAKAVGERLTKQATRPFRKWLGRNSGEVDIEEAFRTKLERKNDILMVFGENDGGLDYVEGHLGHEGAVLRRFDRFQLDVVPHADHTFSEHWMKEWLSRRVVEHLTASRAADEREKSPAKAWIKAVEGHPKP